MGVTSETLSAQWANPTDIFSFLLIIGGDVVQKALAQFAGTTWVPVCFSFGWVAYAFNLIISMTAEGRLMPECDYPCKVINLQNGYSRECRSWMIGRFLVDDCKRLQRATHGLTDAKEKSTVGLTVNVYEWQEPRRPPLDWRHPWTIMVLVLQLGVAAIPWGVWGDWGVFLITAIGTALSFLTGSLPQWTAEKFSCRKNSDRRVAITQGNGSTHVAIVLSKGRGLNLEDLASGRGPLHGSTWELSNMFTSNSHQTPRHSRLIAGTPVGLWFTRVTSAILFIAWVALLISAVGLREHSWFLILVGALGMLQNAIIAASACLPQHRGLNITVHDSFCGAKVMDTLMDLDLVYQGFGKALLEEFFPGPLRESEAAWWNGDKTIYDEKRSSKAENVLRGLPGSTRRQHQSIPKSGTKHEHAA